MPWPPPDRMGQWGRISNEFLKKQQLYATIQRIVEGREQEPEIPPHKTVGSLGDSTHSEGQDVEGSTQGGEDRTQGGEGRTQGDEDRTQDGEGKTQSEGQDVEGSTQGGEGRTQGESRDGETSHQRDRLTKLHRPTWVKELFFSLQTVQKKKRVTGLWNKCPVYFAQMASL